MHENSCYVLQEYENEGNARDIHSSLLCHHFISYEVPAEKTARGQHCPHNKLYEDVLSKDMLKFRMLLPQFLTSLFIKSNKYLRELYTLLITPN
jgi:hypothetical protein